MDNGIQRTFVNHRHNVLERVPSLQQRGRFLKPRTQRGHVVDGLCEFGVALPGKRDRGTNPDPIFERDLRLDRQAGVEDLALELANIVGGSVVVELGGTDREYRLGLPEALEPTAEAAPLAMRPNNAAPRAGTETESPVSTSPDALAGIGYVLLDKNRNSAARARFRDAALRRPSARCSSCTAIIRSTLSGSTCATRRTSSSRWS